MVAHCHNKKRTQSTQKYRYYNINLNKNLWQIAGERATMNNKQLLWLEH